MKNTYPLFTAAFALLTLSAASRPLLADSVDVPWNQVCAKTQGKEMRVTTSTGETVEGYCVAISVDEVSIRTPDNKAVKIAKSALTQIVIPREHQLESLGKGMQKSIRFALKTLPTPAGPLALPIIPATLAWGAVAVPFCAVGDLINIRPAFEIRPH